MATTIVKAKAKKKTKSKGIEAKVDVYVDEKAIYDAGVKALEDHKKAFEGAKKDILEYADEHAAPEDEVVLSGAEHSVKISPKYQVSEMADNETLFKALGKKKFIACAKISVSDLKRYFTDDELEELITTTNSGARRVTVSK